MKVDMPLNKEKKSKKKHMTHDCYQIGIVTLNHIIVYR